MPGNTVVTEEGHIQPDIHGVLFPDSIKKSPFQESPPAQPVLAFCPRSGVQQTKHSGRQKLFILDDKTAS